jgi:hypothetical protein
LRHDEVNFSLQAAIGPGVYSASNRTEYQKQKNNVSVDKARSALKADILTAICEPTVYTMWDPQHLKP